MAAVTHNSKVQVLARYRATEPFQIYLPPDLSCEGLDVSSLPFAVDDATAGTENELQAFVIGKRNNCRSRLSDRRTTPILRAGWPVKKLLGI